MSIYEHPDMRAVAPLELAKSTIWCACSALPSTRNEAISGLMLAFKTIAPGDGNGVFTLIAYSSTETRLVLAEQAGVIITNAGLHTHYALVDATRLLRAWQLPVSSPTPLGAGNPMTFAEQTFSWANPTPL